MKKLIAIQVAMKQEGVGFAEKLKLKEVDQLDAELGFREFHGFYGDHLEIRLFLQGTDERFDAEQVGLEAAAACSALINKKYKPQLLINFGTAGAFTQSGFKIGEVVLVKGPIKFHDRRVPMPGYLESQEGHHGVASFKGLQSFLGVSTGVLSSGSSLELSVRDEQVLRAHAADLKEMEAAAIAWIAEKKKIPFIAIKSITDFIDLPETVADQFLSNLMNASKNVQDYTIKTLMF